MIQKRKIPNYQQVGALESGYPQIREYFDSQGLFLNIVCMVAMAMGITWVFLVWSECMYEVPLLPQLSLLVRDWLHASPLLLAFTSDQSGSITKVQEHPPTSQFLTISAFLCTALLEELCRNPALLQDS